MNCAPDGALSTAAGRIFAVNADLLAVDPVTAARLLLGAVITGRGVSALIVEVEAYGGPPDGPWPDAAAHSFRGPSTRNAVMFGPPGRLYTYRSHGIHVCANVACGPAGTAAAVLLRAATVESGVEFAAARRGPAVTGRPGPWPGQPLLGVGHHHGRQRRRRLRPVLRGDGPARRRVDRRAAARGWGQPGRGPAVAVLAHRTPGGIGVSAQSPRPGRARATERGGCGKINP